jgi:uncharacterized membrane-anchored protein
MEGSVDMKYLSDYIEAKQTELFRRLGTFFAFSNKQFKEQHKEGVKYVNMGMGMLTPKDTVEELINELDRIYAEGIEQDLAENGKDGVIERELYNHEAFYVHSIDSTVDALSGYPITVDEIKAVFYNMSRVL